MKVQKKIASEKYKQKIANEKPYQSNKMTDEERAIFEANSGGFPAPIILKEGDKEQENKLAIFEKVFKELIEGFPNVEFDAVAGRLKNEYGGAKLDHNYNLIVKAWNNVSPNKVSNQEAKNIYNNIFGKQNVDLSKIDHTKQDSNPEIETAAIEKSVEPKIENDISGAFLLNFLIYLICISIPITIFVNAFYKDKFYNTLSWIYGFHKIVFIVIFLLVAINGTVKTEEILRKNKFTKVFFK